jgi:hypothetical protein
VLFALLSAAWATVTPLGGVPDEPAHVIYAAAVVRGQLGTGEGGQVVRVPASVASASVKSCYAFRPDVTADCLVDLDRSGRAVQTRTSAAHYPPLYYALVGWPTLLGFNEIVWGLMRALSILLGLSLLWLGASTWRRNRPEIATGLLLAATPTAGFLLASVNSNGVEICAGIGFGLAVTGVVDRLDLQEPVGRSWAAVAVTGAYLALARPSTYLLLAALGGVLAVHGWPSVVRLARSTPRVVYATAAVLVGAVAAAFAVARLTGPAAGVSQLPAAVGARTAVTRTLLQADDWAYESVGIFGWRDHQPPMQLRVAWVAMTAALVATAFLYAAKRQRAALALLLLGSLLVAPLFVFLSLFKDGVGYQARYGMALTQVVPVLAGAVLAQQSEPGPVARRALAWVPLLTFGLSVLALAGSLLRYAVGLPVSFFPLEVAADVVWLPPTLPLTAVLVAAAGVVATASSRRVREVPELAPDSKVRAA